MNQKKIDKVLLDIYQELYKNAEPSADFSKMMETGEVTEEKFFLKYYLDDDSQMKIINEVLKKHKITDEYYKRKFLQSIILGSSPTSSKRAWIQNT
jgi:hypothetical protein